MLVDMNSFFASVEQQANPFLRGRAVGVCASLHNTSCLIATSKEAKALGIRTGALIYKAKKICPKIILIEAEPEKYREVHRRINRIFFDYTDRVQAYSIDESFLDLDSNPLVIGAEIKKRIRREAGEWLTCSVGIAPNKFMAKLAADLQKPDGLSVVWRENLAEIYQSKKLSDLWGISRGWTKRLGRLGIISPGQLLNYPVGNLMALFGKPGYGIWQRVNGLEVDEIVPEETIAKSFGHSWVLNFRTTDKERLKIVIMRLAEKAARRMRKEGFIAFGMYLSVLMADGNSYHQSKRLHFSLETGLDLYQIAMELWKNWHFKADVSHIAVGFIRLQQKSRQLELFADNFSQLIPALDQINDKYGEFTIRSGLLAATSDYAPDAIAFGK